jgi:hypothetical protein
MALVLYSLFNSSLSFNALKKFAKISIMIFIGFVA